MASSHARVVVSLDAPDRISFQKKWWIVERLGWGGLFILVAAGVSGVFGEGPLAQRVVTYEATSINFPRLLRRDCPTPLIVHTRHDQENIHIAFSRQLVQNLSVQEIVPQPILVHTDDAGAVSYRFSTTRGAVSLVFMVSPKESGVTDGTLAVGDDEPIRLRQFVFP